MSQGRTPSAAVEPPSVSARALGANRINLSWLIKLRWGAICGQLVTIAVVHRLLGVALPLAALLGIVAVEVASNVVATLWLRRRPEISERLAGGGAGAGRRLS